MWCDVMWCDVMWCDVIDIHIVTLQIPPQRKNHPHLRNEEEQIQTTGVSRFRRWCRLSWDPSQKKINTLKTFRLLCATSGRSGNLRRFMSCCNSRFCTACNSEKTIYVLECEVTFVCMYDAYPKVQTWCTWCDVWCTWCDVMWCDVSNVMLRNLMPCDGTLLRDSMPCDVMWFDLMWCDVMWCDVMWCDVM